MNRRNRRTTTMSETASRRLTSAHDRLRKIEKLIGPYVDHPKAADLPRRLEWVPGEELTSDKAAKVRQKP